VRVQSRRNKIIHIWGHFFDFDWHFSLYRATANYDYTLLKENWDVFLTSSFRIIGIIRFLISYRTVDEKRWSSCVRINLSTTITSMLFNISGITYWEGASISKGSLVSHHSSKKCIIRFCDLGMIGRISDGKNHVIFYPKDSLRNERWINSCRPNPRNRSKVVKIALFQISRESFWVPKYGI